MSLSQFIIISFHSFLISDSSLLIKIPGRWWNFGQKKGWSSKIYYAAGGRSPLQFWYHSRHICIRNGKKDNLFFYHWSLDKERIMAGKKSLVGRECRQVIPSSAKTCSCWRQWLHQFLPLRSYLHSVSLSLLTDSDFLFRPVLKNRIQKEFFFNNT